MQCSVCETEFEAGDDPIKISQVHISKAEEPEGMDYAEYQEFATLGYACSMCFLMTINPHLKHEY